MRPETDNKPPKSCQHHLRVVQWNVSVQQVQNPQGDEYSDGVIQRYDAAHTGNGYKLTHEEGGSIFCRNLIIINEANRRNILEVVISET
jgi:hypothetical protein